jgi:RNA polymerase sigma-70 factor (ECF subfamily)
MTVAKRPWPPAPASPPGRPAAVIRLSFLESDADIVAAVRAGEGAGAAALYDRHHAYVRRVLLRVLGPDAELHDLIQDVFVAAIDSIASLQEPNALRAWLAGISVNCAHAELRRRTSRGRWLPLFARSELPPVEAPVSTPEVDEAVRATYHVLRKLSAEERIPFALRFIEGMELVELAAACGVSLATAKRRLARARKKFVTIAQTYPALSDWLAGGEL